MEKVRGPEGGAVGGRVLEGKGEGGRRRIRSLLTIDTSQRRSDMMTHGVVMTSKIADSAI